jgi:NAD(P)-dependent dehydrogenase (short-subunit alcohol dehydrogenase family)
MYAASKAAVNAITCHAASRWGRQGIRANAIAPGLITPKRNMPHVRHVRMGTPDDIASMAVFLLSEDAGYVQGQVISVDGGRLGGPPGLALMMGATWRDLRRARRLIP